ncbi:MAG: AraC family transcriptional regulator [Halieaceae bacterium]|jgi:AraC-like DNA-binding protein|nr:AraC family transcriptional regulator [Halieaceae bacterium]
MATLASTSPAQYILILLDLAQQRGVAPAVLLEGSGLSEADLVSMGARVDGDVFAYLVERAYQLTGDKALGLHLGKRLNLSAHATVGQAFMTCDNLEQVLNFFLKYYRILAPTLELAYTQREGRCWITVTSPWPEDFLLFSYEIFYAAFVYSVNLLVNDPNLTYRVEFPYPEPDYVDEYYELFGEDLIFNAPAGRISLPERWLEARLPSSNAALLALYEQECKRLLADLEEDDSLTEQTLQLLRKLEGHYPQMPRLAEMLNISPRTYRRRLAEENTSFQQLLDTVRTEHATRYLTTTRLPLASIAFMVGFNDVSNFRRAYIKWTGSTPREVREQARSAQHA